MPYVTERNITDIVFDRWDAVQDPRLRQIMQSMISHLHAFVRDIEPTEQEWMTAIEWLTRTAEDSPASPWLPGARYNLARCYEELGQFDLARQWLQSDADSPQRHGNLLRARQLAAERPGERSNTAAN